MNNEYLWEKTGQDHEIEKLEESLAAFRYRETAPPSLPVKKTAHRWNWRFTLAFASAAAAMIMMATWLQIPDSIDTNNATTTFVLDSEIPEPAPVEIKSVPFQPTAAPARPAARPDRPKKNYAAAPLIARSTRTNKSATASLTREERYAYERLMLALSISSSKLKIARDAIDGVHETDNSPSKTDR